MGLGFHNGIVYYSHITKMKDVTFNIKIFNVVMTYLLQNLLLFTEVCESCAPGTFQNQTGQAMCHHCPDGYFSSNMMDRCNPCPPLTYSTGGKKQTTIIYGNLIYV